MIKLLRNINRKIILMITKAIINAAKDSGDLQTVQVNLGHDEIIDSVERIQNFGLTSFPVSGTECIVLCIGGDREHPIVIASDSSEHRPKLSSGETALYNAFNMIVKLKNGTIEIGESTFKKLMTEAFQNVYNTHTHICAAPTNPSDTPLPISTIADVTTKVKAE